MSRPKVLILADDCNPEWPSLPVVGYKYARSLARFADVTVATHVRNRENIEKAGVVELVDTPDLGSGAARCGSSSLPARTFSTTNL